MKLTHLLVLLVPLLAPAEAQGFLSGVSGFFRRFNPFRPARPAPPTAAGRPGIPVFRPAPAFRPTTGALRSVGLPSLQQTVCL